MDTSSGRVTGPITATTSSDSALFAVDDAHQRAAVLVSSAYGNIAPTLSTVDLGAGRLLTQQTLGRAPQTGARAMVTDPAQGGLLVAFAGTSRVFSGGTPAQLVRLSFDGAVQRTRAISEYAALYLDAPHGIVVAVSALSGTDAELAAYDTRTLAPLWQEPAPYQPQAVTVDPAHRRLWLLAEGGRVTILDDKTGRVVATCDPTYQKPAQWTGNKDLVVDAHTGVGYASEHAGADYSTESDWIDRIDPVARRRTTLTQAGGVVVAVLDRTGPAGCSRSTIRATSCSATPWGDACSRWPPVTRHSKGRAPAASPRRTLRTSSSTRRARPSPSRSRRTSPIRTT